MKERFRNSFKLILMLLVLIYLSATAAMANPGGTSTTKNSSLKLEKAKWEETKKGVDYTENFRERTQEITPYKATNQSFKFDNDWMKYLVYAIIFFVLIYLIYRFVAYYLTLNTFKSAPLVTNASLASMEEDILAANLDNFLLEAIKTKNYLLALRIRYLLLLRHLHHDGVISWKKNKTNGEYLFELRESNFFADFQRATYIFERVWYGDTAIGEGEFTALSPLFDVFKFKIVGDES